MTSAEAIDISPGAKRSNRSSFLAKCTAPFVAKQRSQVEQEIRLDEPFRQYAPGDSVKGAIHLTIAKATRITHLVIRLHGFVKVFNRAKLPGEEITYDENLLSSNNGKGRRGTEYFGNGYARLFEDEEVLCGEGRVLGRYEFRFDMVLPPKNMPSSIDFEHGTISYLITSTVTRPVAIAPTSVQHFKLKVQEVIDIASLQKPKPVAFSMETTQKKGKSKASSSGNAAAPKSDRESKSSRESTTKSSTLQANTSQMTEEPPRSPVPSEISSTTATSSSDSSNPTNLGEPSSCFINKPADDITAISDPSIISAKTEVLQGGCLAGDQIPIKITIKHNKAVKNMQGIIVTLYRQGRIDTHPAIPLGPFRKGEKRRYEDYYPKSRTGLGGLSLSAAGSSRSFRQDLAQIVVPIIIDPSSLTTVINTTIEAPPHLFPSVTDVPGAMVSFKYFVEIVADLRAKLTGQDRIRPHLSITSAPQHGHGDPTVSRMENADGVNYHSAPAFNYLITDQLRRTRGVISTKTEIVVGTRDSTRKRGKHSADRLRRSADTSLRNSVDLGREEELVPENRNEHAEPVDEILNWEQPTRRDRGRPPAAISLPQPEEDVDEKTRMRRAEERLLPSEPPRDENQRHLITAPAPSAPSAIDEDDFITRYGLTHPAPAYDGLRTFPTGVQSTGTRPLQHFHPDQEDKQELERQRLLALESSPDDNTDADETTRTTPRAMVPSAPILYQDDIFSLNDPRIPESSPDDFADDHIPPEAQTNHDEQSAPATEGIIAPSRLENEAVQHAVGSQRIKPSDTGIRQDNESNLRESTNDPSRNDEPLSTHER
ncbi:ph-response sensor protein [Lecanora helva]